MRKKSFVPCECKTFFFCKMGKTNGIDHKPKSRKEAKRKRDEKVCTMDRVDIGKGGSYCRPCYRTQRDDKSLKESVAERNGNYSSTRLGCKGCSEQVCNKCWESYDHKP